MDSDPSVASLLQDDMRGRILPHDLQSSVFDDASVLRTPEGNLSPSIAVTPFGEFSRLTKIARDDTVCARLRTRSDSAGGNASAGRCWGTVGRRFDVVSPSWGCWPRLFALQNSKAPVRTDTERKREVDLSTHVVESKRMIESRQLR